MTTAEAQGLSDDEIVVKLVERWLAHYIVALAPAYCRIHGYRVDAVLPAIKGPIEPVGDINRWVDFSVLLFQTPSGWFAASGTLDEQNWLHKGNAVAVFHTEDGYSLKLAFP